MEGGGVASVIQMLVEVPARYLASRQTKKMTALNATICPPSWGRSEHWAQWGSHQQGQNKATSKCLQHCTTGSRGPAKDHGQYNVAINGQEGLLTHSVVTAKTHLEVKEGRGHIHTSTDGDRPGGTFSIHTPWWLLNSVLFVYFICLE